MTPCGTSWAALQWASLLPHLMLVLPWDTLRKRFSSLGWFRNTLMKKQQSWSLNTYYGTSTMESWCSQYPFPLKSFWVWWTVWIDRYNTRYQRTPCAQLKESAIWVRFSSLWKFWSTRTASSDSTFTTRKPMPMIIFHLTVITLPTQSLTFRTY